MGELLPKQNRPGAYLVDDIMINLLYKSTAAKLITLQISHSTQSESISPHFRHFVKYSSTEKIFKK
jgi:hypothetical protein